MRKKSGFTFVEQAIVLVPEFEHVVRKLEQQVTLRGQSKSTLQNYIRRIALFVVHFGKLPELIDPEEINEYLAALARDPRSPSRSSFKHMVYGRYSVRGLSWVMRENLKKTSITKDVNLHSLRHSYATHLLEQGLNIVILKELLGHVEITTTMIYLHVAQCPLIKPHSPLDTLYNFRQSANKV